MNPKTLDELGDLFAAKTGVNLLDLRSDERRRKVIEAKRALVQEAVRNGHKLITIAKWMNAAHSSISRYARAKHCNLEGLTPNI